MRASPRPFRLQRPPPHPQPAQRTPLKTSPERPVNQAAYRQALAVDDGYALAHAGLGHILALAGRHEEGLGHMSRELGQPRAAEARYERALAVDPRNGSALDRLAMSRFGTGRYAAALTLYRTLDQVNPGSATTHANLGRHHPVPSRPPRGGACEG